MEIKIGDTFEPGYYTLVSGQKQSNYHNVQSLQLVKVYSREKIFHKTQLVYAKIVLGNSYNIGNYRRYDEGDDIELSMKHLLPVCPVNVSIEKAKETFSNFNHFTNQVVDQREPQYSVF